MLGVEASERKRNCGEKWFSACKQSLSKRARVSKRANGGGTVWNLPGDAEPEHAESAFLGSGRGGLHVESAIDSYEEVILQ